jgi:CheY-like chemotaxis protein
MGGARILLVEDESITRAYLADILRNDGYEVHEAQNGAEALELFESQHFDLVITDLVMPQLNGFKLTARVRSVSPRTPIILVTAYLSDHAGKTIVEGEAEFIGKPIEPEVLLATIHHLLYSDDLPFTANIYRRRNGSDTWHFRPGCSNWPVDNYAEQEGEPTTGQLCNECKSIGVTT